MGPWAASGRRAPTADAWNEGASVPAPACPSGVHRAPGSLAPAPSEPTPAPPKRPRTLREWPQAPRKDRRQGRGRRPGGTAPSSRGPSAPDTGELWSVFRAADVSSRPPHPTPVSWIMYISTFHVGFPVVLSGSPLHAPLQGGAGRPRRELPPPAPAVRCCRAPPSVPSALPCPGPGSLGSSLRVSSPNPETVPPSLTLLPLPAVLTSPPHLTGSLQEPSGNTGPLWPGLGTQHRSCVSPAWQAPYPAGSMPAVPTLPYQLPRGLTR